MRCIQKIYSFIFFEGPKKMNNFSGLKIPIGPNRPVDSPFIGGNTSDQPIAYIASYTYIYSPCGV
jgi:hypothetical protein